MIETSPPTRFADRCGFSDQTRTTIRDFSKSVSKLNLYCDRLILEAEKGSVMSNQLNPVDEKLVIETTKAAIQLILRYDEYLTTQKQVEEKKKLLSDVDYPEYVRLSHRFLSTACRSPGFLFTESPGVKDFGDSEDGHR